MPPNMELIVFLRRRAGEPSHVRRKLSECGRVPVQPDALLLDGDADVGPCCLPSSDCHEPPSQSAPFAWGPQNTALSCGAPNCRRRQLQRVVVLRFQRANTLSSVSLSSWNRPEITIYR